MTTRNRVLLWGAGVALLLTVVGLMAARNLRTVPGWPAVASADDIESLNPAIQRHFGDHCRVQRVCKDMVGVDCMVQADGTYLYLNWETGRILSMCGIFQGNRYRSCRPRAWDCR